MVSPFDVVPDSLKTKLIDRLLTGAATFMAGVGNESAAENLKGLRSDTPFEEDVFGALERAVGRFVSDWKHIDPELTGVVGSPEYWEAPGVIESISTILLRPAPGGSSEWQTMCSAVETLAPAIPEGRTGQGLENLVEKFREELFSHPKLISLNSLLIGRAMLDTQRQLVVGQSQLVSLLRQIHEEPGGHASLHSSAVISHRPALSSGEYVRNQIDDRSTASQWDFTVSPKTEDAHLKLPDVVAPSTIQSLDIRQAYGSVFGSEIAEWLTSFQEGIIATTITGDFAGQEIMARELLDVDTGSRAFEVTGNYVLGESLRLQADFAQTEGHRQQLLGEAKNAYKAALELDALSARSLRGLGRIYEVEGESSKALDAYVKARLRSLSAYYDSPPGENTEVLHEVLRSTRHYAAFLSEMVAQSGVGMSSREVDLQKARAAVLESQDLHDAILPKFEAHPDWMHIEWFMGLILLAKAYAVVGEIQGCWTGLLYALLSRMNMMEMGGSAPFTAIEFGNLKWWCRTAQDCKVALGRLSSRAEELDSLLDSGDVRTAWIYMEDLVRPLRVPWAVQ